MVAVSVARTGGMQQCGVHLCAILWPAPPLTAKIMDILHYLRDENRDHSSDSFSEKTRQKATTGLHLSCFCGGLFFSLLARLGLVESSPRAVAAANPTPSR